MECVHITSAQLKTNEALAVLRMSHYVIQMGGAGRSLVNALLYTLLRKQTSPASVQRLKYVAL